MSPLERTLKDKWVREKVKEAVIKVILVRADAADK